MLDVTLLPNYVRGAIAVIALGCGVQTFHDMWRSHPYEYVYFNRLSGGLARQGERFEADYWGSSYREGFDRLVHHIQPNAQRPIVVGACYAEERLEYYRQQWNETRFVLTDDPEQGLDFKVITAPGVVVQDPILRQILATRDVERLGDAGASALLDTSPPTDDRPFFFQLLLPRAWLKPELMFSAMMGGGVIYGNVLATIQMLFTFVTVAFLAVFVLGPPLARARRDGAALPDGGTALYFAMLGAGFMLVELALMQRLHVVLGHPTYALVVVLASLLVCTGIGSAVSSRLITTRRATTAAALLAALMLLIVPHVIEPLAHATLSSPLAVRIAWTGGLTGVIGLVLGTLFPSGIRFIERDRGLPVALGINGATSVFGSILSVLVSVIFGITTSLSIAALFYLIAALAGPYRWRVLLVILAIHEITQPTHSIPSVTVRLQHQLMATARVLTCLVGEQTHELFTRVAGQV